MSPKDHSLTEVAAALGVSYRWVRMLVADGRLEAFSRPVTKPNQHNPRLMVTDAELRRFKAERGIA